MSLFKAKDLWLTNCGKDEIFEESSVAVADLEGKGHDQIIVGSHSGFLRVYECIAEDASNICFSPSDLVIETQLDHPILQVAVGRLTSGIKSHHIGVLHPSKIAVYALSITEGTAEHGNEAKLMLMYEHLLLKSTYQLIVGAFGGVKDRDFLCIQSLDGMLLFFEQETFVLDRSLPLFLLPSPVCYVPPTDSFLIFNSEWVLESYSYQVLGESSDRALSPSWRYNLGEPILDIKNVYISDKESAVFVLGERNLFCFTETGTLRFTKRLQYTPVCFHPYYLAQGEKLMVLIVSDTETLLVYENSVLKWSAQLSLLPVALSRVNFKALQSLTLVLSESGELRCCILGTEPSLFVAPPLKNKRFTYKQNEEKLRSLKEDIRHYASPDADLKKFASTSVENDLTVNFRYYFDQVVKACRLSLELSPKTPLSDVQISYHTMPPFCFQVPVQSLRSLSDTIKLVNQLASIDGYDLTNPCLSELIIVISYFNNSGQPKVLRKSTRISDEFLFDSFNPQSSSTSSLSPNRTPKEIPYSISLNASHSVVNLQVLFSEFVNERWKAMGCTESTASFVLRDFSTDEETSPPLTFTISLESSGGKYSVESDIPACLLIGLQSLVARYQRHHGQVGVASSQSPHQQKQALTYSSQLPIDQLMRQIDKYNDLVEEQKVLETELAELSCQSRAVQKRLLIKLKDKRIDSYKSFNSLHEDTHWSILQTTRRVEATQQLLRNCCCELDIFLKLFCLLLELTPHIAMDELKEFEIATSSTFFNAENQNWLNVTDSALQYLLRKEEWKESFEADPFQNIDTFKRRLTAAINRLSKGVAKQIHEEQRGVFPILENENEEESADDASLMVHGPFDAQVETVMKLMPVSERNYQDSIGEMHF